MRSSSSTTVNTVVTFIITDGHFQGYVVRVVIEEGMDGGGALVSRFEWSVMVECRRAVTLVGGGGGRDTFFLVGSARILVFVGIMVRIPFPVLLFVSLLIVMIALIVVEAVNVDDHVRESRFASVFFLFVLFRRAQIVEMASSVLQLGEVDLFGFLMLLLFLLR